MSDQGWCTIESDPGVFWEMISRFGIKGVEVEELFTMDDAELSRLGKVYGFIFLFKWKPELQQARETIPDADVFFAKQVVSNACATQAILNVLLNIPSLEIGPALTNFLSFSVGLDPMTRGEVIGQEVAVRMVHNSFARPATFTFEEKRKPKEEDDAYHFVGYVEKGGVVWELDGLQSGPVFVDCADQATWGVSALRAIRERVEAISRADVSGTGQGISFSLMALTEDRLPQLKAITDPAAAAAATGEITEIESRHAGWLNENIRRRHNYIPALVELFKALSDKGDLPAVIKETVERTRVKEAERTARKKKPAS